MDFRFDWYSELETDVLDPLVDKISDLINQDRSTRGQTKESLERIKIDEQRTAKQFLTALYSSYFVIPKGTCQGLSPKDCQSLLWFLYHLFVQSCHKGPRSS